MNIVDQELFQELFRAAVRKMAGGPWHWFSYHFMHLPPRPFAASIVEAAADCERAMPGLGRLLLDDLGSISGQEKHLPHWDMLNQKLAEILVLRQLFSLPWPSGAPHFEHEPEGVPGGKRPELLVADSGVRYVFEVKAPTILQHIIDRGTNPTQVPGRALARESVERLANGRPVTLPRDNPVKDFLISADAKFAPFKAAQGTCHTVLVVVWDDFIYEPITSLTSEAAQGLLTPRSFAKTPDGGPRVFENVDAVVLIRHLTYFIRAAREEPLVEREHAFDFGDGHALPNVLVPVPNAPSLPDLVAEGLGAVLHNDPILLQMAEYNPPDAVFWIDMPTR